MVVSSPYPSVDNPDVSINEFVLARARDLGDAPPMIDGPSGQRMEFASAIHKIPSGEFLRRVFVKWERKREAPS